MRVLGGCTTKSRNEKRNENGVWCGKSTCIHGSFRKLFCWEGSVLCLTGKAGDLFPPLKVQPLENRLFKTEGVCRATVRPPGPDLVGRPNSRNVANVLRLRLRNRNNCVDIIFAKYPGWGRILLVSVDDSAGGQFSLLVALILQHDLERIDNQCIIYIFPAVQGCRTENTTNREDGLSSHPQTQINILSQLDTHPKHSVLSQLLC